MSKNCLGHLLDFLFCRSIEIDRNNININTIINTNTTNTGIIFNTDNNFKIKTECPICLEIREVEICCMFCDYQSCKKCKYDWYSINKTCPICRQNNVL